MAAPLNKRGGWLTFFLIGQFAAIVICFITLSMLGNAHVELPVLTAIVVARLIISFIMVGLVFSEVPGTPKKIQGLLWLILLSEVVLFAHLNSKFPSSMGEIFNAREVITDVLGPIIWIIYFSVSQRVRQVYKIIDIGVTPPCQTFSSVDGVPVETASNSSAPVPGSSNSIREKGSSLTKAELETLEKLAELQQKGIITKDEFETKKREILKLPT